jgi:hypothetical protein
MRDELIACSVERYSLERKPQWDAFLEQAKNATFLFRRDYMDYHSDRFADYSLMIYREKELVALLPANLAGNDTVASHQGLTYGGLVMSRSATLREGLDCFYAALRYLNQHSISKLLVKRIPSFYCTLPDDDVAYAAFLLEAKLHRQDCLIVVPQSDRLPFQKRRSRQIDKAVRSGIRIVQDSSFHPFWEHVLSPRLKSRYGVNPVHSLEEITTLALRFPDCIKQFSAYRGETILAGTTIYETPAVAHAQYIAVTEEGQKVGALDHLFGWLINEQYRNKRFFDFGNCSENEGRSVNRGLLDWKEGFGGRCYTQEFYEVHTRNHIKLEPVLGGNVESSNRGSEIKSEKSVNGGASGVASPVGGLPNPLTARTP